jgi:very-short-patch-repair endonuclease
MKEHGVAREQFVTTEKREIARGFRKSMTEAESLLWGKLRGKQAGGFKFRRQQVIDGFVVDFFCCSARISIELDGKVHDATKDYDYHRDKILEARGILVLRFTNQRLLEDFEKVIAEIVAVCRDRSV